MEMHGGPAKRKRRKPTAPDSGGYLSPHEEEVERIERWQVTSLAEVGLPVRTINTLEDNDILTVGQLCQLTAIELQAMPNLGDVTIKKCREILAGLRLPNELTTT